MRKLMLLLGVAALAISGSANATVLLNVGNPAFGTTPYALSFVATSTSTTLNVAGYYEQSFETADDNGVFASGSATNLLGQMWSFTPAAAGSDADQFNDGTPVNGLFFEGTSYDYDIFSQTFATTFGETYTYDFNLDFSFNPGPNASGFEVYGNVASAVPEPGVWALMLAGLGGLGAALRLSRRKQLPALA